LNEEGSILNHIGGDIYQIKVRGEIWKAESPEAFNIGDKVKVSGQSDRDHLVLIIKKL